MQTSKKGKKRKVKTDKVQAERLQNIGSYTLPIMHLHSLLNTPDDILWAYFFLAWESFLQFAPQKTQSQIFGEALLIYSFNLKYFHVANLITC